MIKLDSRGIIEVSGKDAASFLNNLLTNEILNLSPNSAKFCALLTPQGKFLFDIFIFQTNDNSFLLDSSHPEELFSKLMMYKLRADVQISRRDDLAVFASTGDQGQYIAFPDPRDRSLGFRIFAPPETPQTQTIDTYESLRLSLGIPDLSRDLIREQDFALEGLLDELGAIDFQKGCYVGQEMTSRMKRRGTLKQKLCRFRAQTLIPFGAKIMANDTEIGEIRTNNGEYGIALLRFDRWREAAQNGQTLLAEGQEITIDPPDWILI